MLFLSGDEAVATAAFDAGVKLGTGYPGTPSTEILEWFESLGGRAQWSPNEKVALEVGIGVAYAGARAIVTMKHVGLNVAADPLFTVAYTGVSGALVIVSADDPGMASSQNEQDNRRYAVAAAVPMLEPSDSQEAYDFTLRAIEISERWRVLVLLRITTRVCHSKTVVRSAGPLPQPRAAEFVHDVRSRVMIPAFARPAHHNLREKLRQIASWNDSDGPNQVVEGSHSLGIITSGISYQHRVADEVDPDLSQECPVRAGGRELADGERDVPLAVDDLVGHLARERRHVDALGRRRRARHAREREQVVDEALHPVDVLADDAGHATAFVAEGRAVVLEQHRREAVDRAQRRAQVVRHRVAERLELARSCARARSSERARASRRAARAARASAASSSSAQQLLADAAVLVLELLAPELGADARLAAPRSRSTWRCSRRRPRRAPRSSRRGPRAR